MINSVHKIPGSLLVMLWGYLFFLVCPLAFCVADNSLGGLREGRVFIRVDQSPVTLKLKYRPIYGWDEPILVFSPDGRIMAQERFGHKRPGSTIFHLDNGRGIYVLLLKPSYVYSVETSAEKMVFSPEPDTFGLYKTISNQPFFFHVPGNTGSFRAFFSNIHKCKGYDAAIEIFDPHFKRIVRRQRPGIKKDDCNRALTGLTTEELQTDQRGSDVVLSSPPPELLADSIEILNPEKGFWTIKVGTTVGLPYKISIWFDGIPNYLANKKKSWFLPRHPDQPVKASIQLAKTPLSFRPFLGIVGHMDKPGSETQKMLKKWGQRGDKLFLWQDKMMPEAGGFHLTNKERFSPTHNVFSLVVFRKEASRLHKASLTSRLSNWGLWASKSSKTLLKQVGRDPETFALQILNEPNLEMAFNEYCAFFSICARTVKKCSSTSRVRFAGPGLGSGEELSLVDWSWITNLVKKHDSLLDVITWNMYRIKNLEDTFLYKEAIEKTNQILRQEDSDGQIEDIIIGATNREGGISPDRLYNTWDAAIWWASTLIQSINTGRLKGIYYYNVIDKGYGRKKGIFNALMGPKSQAYVHKLFSEILSYDEIYRVTSNHSSLEAVAAKRANRLKLIILNKGWRHLSVSVNRFPSWIKKFGVQRLDPDGSLKKLSWAVPLLIEPKEILILSAQ